MASDFEDGYRRCQFIPGPLDKNVARDPERHDSLFCGDPTCHVLLPYCEAHTKVCYLPVRKPASDKISLRR